MRQGFLILHEKRGRPRACFFSLEDGFLRYFATTECRRLVGEVRLSGCKLAVKAHKRHDGVPHSFFLEARKVFVKDRTYTLGAATRVELSAHSPDERQEWGKALFSWQRYYWRDPQGASNEAAAAQHEDVRQQLEQTIDKLFASKGESPAASLAAGIALGAAKQPLGFLRRNASSLRRSLSVSLSASSTASTSSSNASERTPTKSVDPAADCAVVDKVKLGKLGGCKSQPSKQHSAFPRAVNNQEEHVC